MSNTGASPYDASAEAGTMDLDGLDGGTSPFITLDACDGTLVSRMVTALEEAASGDNAHLAEMIYSNPTVAERLSSQGIVLN